MKRPSEVIQATAGTIVGAVLIVLGAFTDTSKITAEVTGAIVILVSYIAAVVTYFVAKGGETSTPGA